MRKLHDKIEHHKRSISHKKSDITKDWDNIKERLTSQTGISLSVLSGLVIGFLFLPKKAKLLRLALKAYAVTGSVKQILNLLPHETEHKKTSRPRKHLH